MKHIFIFTILCITLLSAAHAQSKITITTGIPATPTFAGLTSNGVIKLIGQSGTPTAPAVSTQNMYADSTGAFTLQGSNGFAFSISKNRLTANHRVFVQNKDYTLADSATVALKLDKSDSTIANRVTVNTTAIAGKQAQLSGTGYVKQSGTTTSYPSLIPIADGGTNNTSFTSGYVPYYDGTKIASSGAFWDNSNGRLGIGTATPAQLLEVANTSGSAVVQVKAPATGGFTAVVSLTGGTLGTNTFQWLSDGLNSYFKNTSGSGGSFKIRNSANLDMFTANFNAPASLLTLTSNGVGINSSSASFTLDVNGTGRFQNTLITAGKIDAFASKTAAYTLTATDEVIKADATTTAFSTTLPTAVSKTGQEYTIKKIDASANAVTVATTSSQTIDGSTTYLLSAQWKYVKVVSDGANWLIISSN